MKISYLLLLSVCATSSVYAAAPVLDASSGNSSDSYTHTQLLDNVSKLQNEVTQLKSKIADQSLIINDLKVRQNKLDSFHTTNPATATIPHNDAKASAGEKSRYEYAYTLFRNGNNDQAISEFQSMIKTYPNGEYADNSQYWTGEALLKKGDKHAAMRAFDRVVNGYPGSAKIPDALLKLGMTQASLGNTSKAKEYYDYLIATYPGTPSAGIAYTKRAGL